MDRAGATPEIPTTVLAWTAQVLTEADLRRVWNGEQTIELGRRTVVTPLARERLRECGVAMTWRPDKEAKTTSNGWGLAVESNDVRALSVIRACGGEGRNLTLFEGPEKKTRSQWYGSLAEKVSSASIRGLLVFCSDAAVCVCVAAKAPGVRPAMAVSAARAARVLITLGCNFMAIETTGRTFFELRQIVQTICDSGKPEAPPEVAAVLKELDGRAHR
jgi:hypothetical protein